MRAVRFASVLLLASLASAGCSNDTSPTTPTTPTSPVTDTWTGIIAPGGTASRSVPARESGTITATLTSADVPLWMGIGVPRVANGGCRLTVSQMVTSGESISIPAAAGIYCVQLFDEGEVVKQAGFVVQIVYP